MASVAHTFHEVSPTPGQPECEFLGAEVRNLHYIDLDFARRDGRLEPISVARKYSRAAEICRTSRDLDEGRCAAEPELPSLVAVRARTRDLKAVGASAHVERSEGDELGGGRYIRHGRLGLQEDYLGRQNVQIRAFA